MWIKSLALGVAGFALISCGLSAPSLAQDIPNILVMTEDSDPDTVPRNSRVQRNILGGLQDRLNQRGYRVFDEQALGITGYQEETQSDRVRRTDQELIIVARTANQPIDVIVVYEVFASVEKLDFASFARLRIFGRALDPESGRFIGNFEVVSPDTFRLPVQCPKECLLEKLSAEGRDMGIELASVLSDKLDSFFSRHGGGVAVAPAPAPSGGAVAVAPAPAPAPGGGVGFERSYTLVFEECSQQSRMDFEPYLVIFQGYLDHRPDVCTGTECKMQYTSTIAPGKLHRNLEKMLVHSNHRGRVYVQGNEYTVFCVPERRRHPLQLDPGNW
ncbi:MAG: hypothetical protein ACFBSD_09415 [Paracoccaceae bacterium]